MAFASWVLSRCSGLIPTVAIQLRRGTSVPGHHPGNGERIWLRQRRHAFSISEYDNGPDLTATPPQPTEPRR
jgi:hypothetical protein